MGMASTQGQLWRTIDSRAVNDIGGSLTGTVDTQGAQGSHQQNQASFKAEVSKPLEERTSIPSVLTKPDPWRKMKKQQPLPSVARNRDNSGWVDVTGLGETGKYLQKENRRMARGETT